MLLDAIVLAGGKSSRLFGVPKSTLLWRGSTLLQNTVDAVLDAGACRVVVVGPGASLGDGAVGGLAGGDAPAARMMFAREDPPFGGPAAAVAAGLSALDVRDVRDALVGQEAAASPDVVLVLACDMPGVSGAVDTLVAALPALVAADDAAAGDAAALQGAILLDGSGMRQPLAAVYSRSALADAVDGLRASNTLDGASMRSLIASFDLLELADADGTTRDVDTWGDAAAFGIERPDGAPPTPHEKES